jgi:hypothetical protein
MKMKRSLFKSPLLLRVNCIDDFVKSVFLTLSSKVYTVGINLIYENALSQIVTVLAWNLQSMLCVYCLQISREVLIQ